MLAAPKEYQTILMILFDLEQKYGRDSHYAIRTGPDAFDLVTVMYCNEVFNPGNPDTFFEPVK